MTNLLLLFLCYLLTLTRADKEGTLKLGGTFYRLIPVDYNQQQHSPLPNYAGSQSYGTYSHGYDAGQSLFQQQRHHQQQQQQQHSRTNQYHQQINPIPPNYQQKSSDFYNQNTQNYRGIHSGTSTNYLTPGIINQHPQQQQNTGYRVHQQSSTSYRTLQQPQPVGVYNRPQYQIQVPVKKPVYHQVPSVQSIQSKTSSHGTKTDIYPSTGGGGGMPYEFSYQAVLSDGLSSRREVSDGNRVTGFYTIMDADGRQRIVQYVADEGGFRAEVKTNEPGVEAKHPSNALFLAQEPNRYLYDQRATGTRYYTAPKQHQAPHTHTYYQPPAFRPALPPVLRPVRPVTTRRPPVVRTQRPTKPSTTTKKTTPKTTTQTKTTATSAPSLRVTSTMVSPTPTAPSRPSLGGNVQSTSSRTLTQEHHTQQQIFSDGRPYQQVATYPAGQVGGVQPIIIQLPAGAGGTGGTYLTGYSGQGGGVPIFATYPGGAGGTGDGGAIQTLYRQSTFSQTGGGGAGAGGGTGTFTTFGDGSGGAGSGFVFGDGSGGSGGDFAANTNGGVVMRQPDGRYVLVPLEVLKQAGLEGPWLENGDSETTTPADTDSK